MANGMLGGFDPQEIQQMMAQFGATEKERSDANKQALFALGFGLLGGRKGNELQTIGRAGLGALDYRNRTLADIPQQKAQQFNAATQMLSLQDKLRQRQEQRELSDILGKMPPPGAPAPSPMAQMPSLAPTNANAAQLATLQAAQPQQQAAANDPFAIYMAQANYLDSTGHPAARAEAAKLRDQALKWREKYAEPKVVMRGGKPVYERFGEYGGQREVTGAEVPPDFMTVARGGTTDVLNKYNLPATGQSFAHTPTFGERTGQGQLALAQQKFAYDQAQAAAGGGPVGKEAFANANVLRDEYTKQSAPFIAVRDAYRRIQSAAESAKTDAGGAADIAMVTSYMKVLDPGSTVNQGEYANVQNSGGVPAWVRAQYNRLVDGGSLAPSMRDSIVKAAHGLYKKADEAHGNTEKRYRGLAERLKVDPENVIVDFRLEGTEPVLSTPAGASPVVDRAQTIVDSWKKRKQ